MGITRSSDLREYTCIVERPGGKSYLFFEEFKMEVTAPGLILKEVDVEVRKWPIFSNISFWYCNLCMNENYHFFNEGNIYWPFR